MYPYVEHVQPSPLSDPSSPKAFARRRSFWWAIEVVPLWHTWLGRRRVSVACSRFELYVGMYGSIWNNVSSPSHHHR